MPATEPIHFENLRANLAEVRRLVEIHAELTGTERGRRHNVAILNKSGIVLVVACWEAFVEDLATHSFSWLLAQARSPDAFPKKVLALASKEYREAADARRVWELAGEGWRTALERHKADVLKRHVGKLNTPRAAQVDALFGDLVGLGLVSTSWVWGGVSNAKVKLSLDDLVTLRGEIAHRAKTSRPVLKKEVRVATELVERLAVHSSNHVRQFLMTKIAGPEPWREYVVAEPAG